LAGADDQVRDANIQGSFGSAGRDQDAQRAHVLIGKRIVAQESELAVRAFRDMERYDETGADDTQPIFLHVDRQSRRLMLLVLAQRVLPLSRVGDQLAPVGAPAAIELHGAALTVLEAEVHAEPRAELAAAELACVRRVRLLQDLET